MISIIRVYKFGLIFAITALLTSYGLDEPVAFVAVSWISQALLAQSGVELL